MPDPTASSVEASLRAANARLREVIEAKDAEIEALRHGKDDEIAELRGLVDEARLRIA